VFVAVANAGRAPHGPGTRSGFSGPDVPTCRRTWPTLRPLDPNVRYPRETAYETLISSSSNAEWHRRLATAPRFIEYIEHDVIGNPAAFGKLTF
jgi:hypothetical protein